MDPPVPVHAAKTTWHICWQAVAGHDLIAGGALAERIRGRLLDAHAQRDRVLVDYLLAPTEIHVLSKLTASDSPGAVARAVATIVARWVRDLMSVRGPVFAGPFRAHRVGSLDALRIELRMLAWRPVALGLCTAPAYYPHSALRTTLGLRRAMGFDARPQLALFGDEVPAARAALRAWLARRPSAMEVRQWELSRGLALAIGTVGPLPLMSRQVRGAAAALVAAAGADGIDGALRILERWVLARLGLRGVDRLADVPGAIGARGRALVACLAVDMSLCPAASVARHFMRARATLCEQMKACRQRAEDRRLLAMPAHRIAEEAIGLVVASRESAATAPGIRAG
ncbi:MAG: hypothetical protein QM702_02125 [Rubrivivax sp.]